MEKHIAGMAVKILQILRNKSFLVIVQVIVGSKNKYLQNMIEQMLWE
jgi:hypothetical protein